VNRVGAGLAAALFVLLAAPRADAHDPPRTKVTWTGDIQPLVQARCIRCHSPGGKGPMSLATYEEARPYASAMREEVLARRMPKWHAARGYGQFANDPALSPFDISLVVAWVDGGALRGDPLKPAAPVPAAKTPRVRTRKVTIACGETALPAGTLLAFTPRLTEGDGAGFSVMLPGGEIEILAWVRDYERDFAETYWLETPLMLPRGSRLRTDGPVHTIPDRVARGLKTAGSQECRLTLHLGT
jgi:hypothetical protein